VLNFQLNFVFDSHNSKNQSLHSRDYFQPQVVFLRLEISKRKGELWFGAWCEGIFLLQGAEICTLQ